MGRVARGVILRDIQTGSQNGRGPPQHQRQRTMRESPMGQDASPYSTARSTHTRKMTTTCQQDHHNKFTIGDSNPLAHITWSDNFWGSIFARRVACMTAHRSIMQAHGASCCAPLRIMRLPHSASCCAPLRIMRLPHSASCCAHSIQAYSRFSRPRYHHLKRG